MKFLVISQVQWSPRAKLVTLQIVQDCPLKGYRFQKMMPKSIHLEIGKQNQLPEFITKEMFSDKNRHYITKSLICQLKMGKSGRQRLQIDSEYQKYDDMVKQLQQFAHQGIKESMKTDPGNFVGRLGCRILHVVTLKTFLKQGVDKYYSYGSVGSSTEYSIWEAQDQMGNVIRLRFTGNNSNVYSQKAGKQGTRIMIFGTVKYQYQNSNGVKTTAIRNITSIKEM